LGDLGGVHRSDAREEVAEETAQYTGRFFNGGRLNKSWSHLGDASSLGDL
jgi:hypothetical protein